MVPKRTQRMAAKLKNIVHDAIGDKDAEVTMFSNKGNIKILKY